MLSGRLPTAPTPFVGRDEELLHIIALLADPGCRLLTLVGPGGIGKTRLAIEAASRLTVFTDGVYFVPLQSINAVEHLTAGLATALNLQLHALTDPDQQLLHYLMNKQLLLLLDNFEHLLDGAPLLANLLLPAPQVKLLVTSRETLNLREEWVHLLDGLDYPRLATTKALEAFSAVQLFVARVRQVRDDFSLAAEHEGVRRICQMVEGMPLALELAAARAKTLPCDVIADEVQQNIAFLSASLRNLPERHRSMQAVFGWSWQLLTKAEQTAFMKLSVFWGGFKSDAARAVADVTLETLSALVEKSLLRIDGAGRYQFHDLLRRFAFGKLNEVPELRDHALDAHGTYFAQFLSERQLKVKGQQKTTALKELEDEIANLRAAWDWAVEHHKFEMLQKAHGGLASLYDANSWFQEGASLFHSAAAALQFGKRRKRHDALLGDLLLQAARWDCVLGQLALATNALHESLAIFRQIGDQRSTAAVLLSLSWVAYAQGEFTQTSLYAQEALALATQIGDDVLVADAKYELTNICEATGKYGQARQLIEEAQLTYRQHGMWGTLSNTLAGLAAFELLQGDYERARDHLQEAMTIAENEKNPAGVGHAHELLGQVAYAVGDFDAGRSHLQEGLQIARDLPVPRLAEWCLLHSGSLACATGEYDDARKAFQDVLALTAAEGERWKQARAIAGLGRVAFLTGNRVAAKQYLTESLTRSRELGFRWGEAQTLTLLGRIAAAEDDFQDARQRFAEALQVGLEIETPRVLLEILVGMVEFRAADGDPEEAHEFCVLCLHHPALDADSRAQANRLLNRFNSEIASPASSPLVPTSSSDLRTLAARVLMGLSAAQGDLASQMNPWLTARELDILRLLVTRRTNREIADELFISVGTVKTHVHHICRKLQVAGRQQAAARAAELHLL